MDPSFGVLSLLAVAGALAAARYVTQSSRSEALAADEAWEQAARRLGGTATLPEKGLRTFLDGGRRILSFEVEGVEIELSSFAQMDGKTRVHYTQVESGALPGAALLDLAVRPRSKLDPRRLVPALEKLGRAPLQTGDPAFDDAFRVTGHPGSVVIELLDHRLRRRFVDAAEGATMDGGVLVDKREGLANEASPLVSLGRFYGEIVRRWVELAEAPVKVASALGLGTVASVAIPSTGDRLLARGLVRGVEVSLLLRRDGERVRTVLALGERGELTFDRMAVDPAEAKAELERRLDEADQPYR